MRQPLRRHDVLCLDAKDGKRLWDFAAGDSVLSTPVVDAGRVTFGSFDGNVYAVDAASGALAWKHDTGAPVVSTPALHEGRVIVSAFVAVGWVTGKMAWRFPVAKPKDDSTYGFAASPAVGEGLVFAGAVDGKVYAFVQ